jgi:hypothetical protein
VPPTVGTNTVPPTVGTNTVPPTVGTNTVVTNTELDVVDFTNPPKKMLRFDENDHTMSVDHREEIIHAPKNIDRLEQISDQRNEQRKLDEDDEDDEKIKIAGDVDLKLDNIELDIIDMNVPNLQNVPMI